jgi:xanthine dehydrogenase accessory factor
MLLSRREGDGVVRAVITAERAENFGSSNPLRQATAEARRRLAARDSETDLLWSADGEKPRDPEHQDFVLMRPLLPGDFQLLLFGAGHVGRALVRVLEPLVDRIVWSDGRPEEFPALLPPNVRADSGDPFELIAAMPPGALYLVMTHNHSLDLALCEAVLQRRDHAYLGLIGSASKRRRFEKHLREEGLTDADLQRLTSPIGVPGIRSKEPAAIAVAVAAQLLQVRERLVACGSKRATSAVVRSA